jgi:hypothetical protein
MWRLAPDFTTLIAATANAMAIRNRPDSAACQVECIYGALSLLRRWPGRGERVLSRRWVLAQLIVQYREYPAAERELREILEDARTALGDSDRLTLNLRRSLATVLRERGQLDAAENELTAALYFWF